MEMAEHFTKMERAVKLLREALQLFKDRESREFLVDLARLDPEELTRIIKCLKDMALCTRIVASGRLDRKFIRSVLPTASKDN
jgi:hypothetical protein